MILDKIKKKTLFSTPKKAILKNRFSALRNKNSPYTITAGGHAHAHDPEIDIMRMSPDLGIFAPLKMPMRITQKYSVF